MGVDLIAILNLKGESAELPNAVNWPGGRAVMITQAFAHNQKLRTGDVLKVVAGAEVHDLTVAALIPEIPDLPSPPESLLLMDLPDAQQLLRRVGEVDRLEVLVQRGDAFPNLRADTGTLLTQASLGRWRVQSHEDKQNLAGTMTEAFRLNLTILSLLALFVGGYLIYQALDGVVLRRRGEIGVLKSLGVTSRSIQQAFLLEALALGLLGGGIGILLGWAGAQGAVLAVSQTMNALYGATSAQGASLPLADALLCLSLSVVISLVAAWWPAREAAHTPPVQMMGQHSVPYEGKRVSAAEQAGLVCLLIAAGLSLCPPWRLENATRIPLASYAAAGLWLLGAGLAAGRLLRSVGQLAQSLGKRSATWRVALSHVRRPSARHRLAVAALTSAVGMTAGMIVMVGSFDDTMRSWILRSMKADIYIASAADQSGSSAHLIPQSKVAAICADPGVQEHATLMATRVSYGSGTCWVMGEDAATVSEHGLHSWVAAPPPQWWLQPSVVLINESFSERHQLDINSTLQVPTPSGAQTVTVVGIFTDYGNEHGSVVITQDHFRQWFGIDDVWRVALFTKTAASADEVRDRLQAAHPGLSIFTQKHLRNEALRIFQQTFSVTYALQVIGVIVAVTGLGLALASLLLERQATQDTLRSLGMTQREALQAAVIEGVCLSSVGSLCGLAGGLWLGWLLIYRINKQCFGWTLSYHLPWLQLTMLVAAVTAVGAAVAALVAWRLHQRK
jgi:putative ABC transport system permease protein